MNTTTNGRIYRFHDQVAFHIGTSETLYVSTATALRFAHALIAVCSDIDSTKFTDSVLNEVNLEEFYHG